MYKLIINRNRPEMHEVPLRRGTTTIGRKFDSDIKIDDTTVSGHHARIVWLQTPMYLQDLGSTNGTYINDKRIGRHELCHGDVISVGNQRLVFIDTNHKNKPTRTPAAEPRGQTTLNLRDIEELITRVRNQGSKETGDGIIIPDGIRWVAQDGHGIWWGFEHRPVATQTGWLEKEISNFIKIGRGTPNSNWRKSLCRI